MKLQRHRSASNPKSPFFFPTDDKLFSFRDVLAAREREQKLREAGLPVEVRPTFRGRTRQDLRQRLYVEQPPEEESVTEKRKKRRVRRGETSLRPYLLDVRRLLLYKLNEGWLRDEALRIEDRQMTEEKLLAMSRQRLRVHEEAFDRFLEHDFQRTLVLLQQAEELTLKGAELEEENRELQRQLGVAQRRVYLLEERWRQCKTYQHCLMQASPTWWRKDNDPTFAAQPKELSIHKQAGDDVEDLDSIITAFLEETKAEAELQKKKSSVPKMFFTEPQELLDVFQAMEQQVLNSLLHSEDMSAPLEDMNRQLMQTQKKYDDELSEMSDKMNDLVMAIRWEEERACELQRKTRSLLEGRFKDLVVGDEVLALYGIVEDAYDSCIGPNDNRLPLDQLMKALENKYESLMLSLDSLPPEMVSRTMHSLEAEDERRLRLAKQAEVEAHRMRRRENRLLQALQPKATVTRTHGRRSAVPTLCRRRPPPLPPLTESQIDWLVYRADYCPHTDRPEEFLVLKEAPPTPQEQDEE